MARPGEFNTAPDPESQTELAAQAALGMADEGQTTEADFWGYVSLQPFCVHMLVTLFDGRVDFYSPTLA